MKLLSLDPPMVVSISSFLHFNLSIEFIFLLPEQFSPVFNLSLAINTFCLLDLFWVYLLFITIFDGRFDTGYSTRARSRSCFVMFYLYHFFFFILYHTTTMSASLSTKIIFHSKSLWLNYITIINRNNHLGKNNSH